MNAVVSATEWRAARVALLAKEKALTRARDAVNAERAALPSPPKSRQCALFVTWSLE